MTDTNNIYVLNLSSDTTPIINEVTSRNEWVDFGKKNDYYNYLYERYLYSTTNNAVINNFAKLIFGDGLTSPEMKDKPNGWAKALTCISGEDIFKIGLDLKLYGQATIQVLGGRSMAYLPVQNTRLEKKDKDGKINGVWFSDNFANVRKSPPVYIPMFDGVKAKKDIEVIYIQMHTPNQPYYSLPDYVGCLPYAELEENIADYLLNDVKTGFAGKTMISFKNGEPSEEVKRKIVADIQEKLTGSKGQQIIVEFVDGTESVSEITTIPLNDAPTHYQYVSEEAQGQILKSHNVTSGLIFGIAKASGFSSNADELKNSWNLYMTSIVAPYQLKIAQALQSFMSSIEMPIKLGFSFTNPFGSNEKFSSVQLENIKQSILDVNSGVMTYEQARAYLEIVVGINRFDIAKILPEEVKLSKENILLQELIDLGEDMTGYELVSEYIVNHDDEDVELASVGTSFPNAKSTLDDDNIKVRYAYKGGVSDDTREFCTKMVGANKVWRKEDIVGKNYPSSLGGMSAQPVNKGFGVGGADTYDIFKYKGGARCSHNWVRQLYLKEGANVDVNSPLAKQIDSFTARAMGSKLPAIGQEVVKPKDMLYKGYTEAYYTKHFA